MRDEPLRAKSVPPLQPRPTGSGLDRCSDAALAAAVLSAMSQVRGSPCTALQGLAIVDRDSAAAAAGAAFLPSRGDAVCEASYSAPLINSYQQSQQQQQQHTSAQLPNTAPPLSPESHSECGCLPPPLPVQLSTLTSALSSHRSRLPLFVAPDAAAVDTLGHRPPLPRVKAPRGRSSGSPERAVITEAACRHGPRSVAARRRSAELWSSEAQWLLGTTAAAATAPESVEPPLSAPKVASGKRDGPGGGAGVTCCECQGKFASLKAMSRCATCYQRWVWLLHRPCGDS